MQMRDEKCNQKMAGRMLVTSRVSEPENEFRREKELKRTDLGEEN